VLPSNRSRKIDRQVADAAFTAAAADLRQFIAVTASPKPKASAELQRIAAGAQSSYASVAWRFAAAAAATQ
jgi:hypothetical protein